MEKINYEKVNNETLNENNAVKKFRNDIIIFLAIANVIMFLTLMFTPTLMAKPAIYLYSTQKKPAIYSYPQKPTKIHITLSKTILIGTDIPKYHNGWNVIAYPNGKIIDLQPKYTSCKKLKQNKVGFEYAYSACINNNYPYIFWEGTQITKTIPKKNQGWLIKKSDIGKFLSDRLDEMEFNKTEKKDFIDYWQYTLSNKNSNYFFIYFLQNEEVEKYAPMHVSPKPDSINRILMIVQPLNKPFEVKEQKLQRISRKGFAIVEWGGIIKKKNLWSR